MRRINFFAYLTVAAIAGYLFGYGARPDPRIVTVIKNVPVETIITRHECNSVDAVKWWNNSDLRSAKLKLCGIGK
jgi:hypothetical protein